MSAGQIRRAVTLDRDKGTWCVLLDGRPAKTPAGRLLALPSHALAMAVAEEWRRQGARPDRSQMKFAGLAACALDLSPSGRRDVVANTLAFGRTDLLCYRADEPPELAARQASVWDPLLDWADETLGTRLLTGHGIAFVDQPSDSLQALEARLNALNNFRLCAIQVAAALSGSLVLALALEARRLTAEETFSAAHLEELFQAGKWGLDEEAEASRSRRLADLETVENFLRLIGA
jgi:chaperone required for assembly of F1-ATPase